jgi:predicted nucleic-acid-binding protein
VNAADTNVLVRYIVRDVPDEFDKAAAFLTSRSAADPAFVSVIVLVELIWVLARHYGYGREAIHALLRKLLATAELRFEDAEFLSTLINSADGVRGDIADHLIARSAARAGCTRTVTFDRRAARLVPGMELLA